MVGGGNGCGVEDGCGRSREAGDGGGMFGKQLGGWWEFFILSLKINVVIGSKWLDFRATSKGLEFRC